jgi:hypothetical protein
MDEDRRRGPRLIPTEREALAPIDDRESDTDTGNYIGQLASAWAAVRKKSIESL